ncbi:DUF475 domain-containing protein [Streptomyces sp. 3MP-14]|uniref:DUF475 domain-containing protein n=1 Tax=Streptomyces mimosae TaxID=2586635 RepID=A0A5N6ASZ5_9ACTN|nr:MULTISPECIES: DUF475 domain-containing protein [Streptomyces]KAB8170839.1 DUF475 domain-containing protein [Streptomyces mimosae]KAB8179809.1 DUF475 domain-containing protein [Streptomyces sp. 3MP-14]
MILKTFGWSFGVTVAGLAVALYFWGWEGFAVVAILSVLEISLSFDNAVVNAGVLKRMNEFWQKIFLTIGILIAVFGMRLVFPVLIVAVTAGVGPIEAVELALDDPDQYSEMVTDAHPSIAAFGGMFLLMIALNFVFEEREVMWARWLEKPLSKLGRIDGFSVGVALAALLLTATTVASQAYQHGGLHADKTETVLLSGLAGLLTYLLVGGLSGYFEHRLEDDQEKLHEAEEAARRAGKKPTAIGVGGKAAFFLFLYLEVLDASFSFDGVIGAFAITNHIFWMALGLGIGAMYVRSLTIYLVRQGTLDDYRYLEHGAHYAIGALAVMLLISIRWHLPEVVTGLVGVGLIGWAFYSSVRANRRDDAAGKGHRQISDEV